MEKKRLDLVELRRQRERIRRVTVGALVGALAFVLVSCQGLTLRADTERARAQPIGQAPGDRGTGLSYEAQAASPTDRPHQSLLDSAHGRATRIEQQPRA